MKKGFIPLLLSFVIGAFALYNLLRGRFHFVYLPMRVELFGSMLEMPRLTMPPNVIMITLGVAVNLFAMIFVMPSLAVGAAVFYGMSIGLAPESYPYVILELALCLFAAMRMKVRSGGMKRDPMEPEHIHYTDGMNSAGENLSGGKRDSSSGGSSWFVLKSDDDLGRARLGGTIPAASAPLSQSAGAGTKDKGTRNKSAKNAAGQGYRIGQAVTINGQAAPAQRKKNSNGLVALLVIAAIAIGAVSALVPNPFKKHATDLTGSWQMKQATEGSTSMKAQIDEDTIKVYWQTQDNQSIPYWAGTYTPPEDDTLPYTWVSENTMGQDSGSAFAAKDSTKTFLYDGDALRFSVSDIGSVKMSVSLYR